MKIQKKHLVALSALALALIPEVAFAATTGEFGAQALDQKVGTIKDFLFNNVIGYGATFGGAAACIYTIWEQNYSRALGFAGASLGAWLMPTFIDGVFASGMLLP